MCSVNRSSGGKTDARYFLFKRLALEQLAVESFSSPKLGLFLFWRRRGGWIDFQPERINLANNSVHIT
jgi:hypothetical protein